jgi:leucyl-tRNA synthetase
MAHDLEEVQYIEEKWQKRWQEAKIFEAEPVEGQKKYFLNFP